MNTREAEAFPPRRPAQLARGEVKWFNDSKGYGFIRPLDSGGDIFVHHSNIQREGYRTLLQGDQVEFLAVLTPRGFQASRVSLVSEAAS
jgi:CspA family cold shock protein